MNTKSDLPNDDVVLSLISKHAALTLTVIGLKDGSPYALQYKREFTLDDLEMREVLAKIGILPISVS